MSDTTTQRTRRLRLPSFSVQVLLGLGLGILLGWVALQMGPTAAGDPNWLTTTLDTIGASFVTLLKTIVPPLVFLAIVASIANLQQVTNAARLAWQTLLWFAITAAISVAIGIGLGLVFQPGNNSTLSPEAGSEVGTTGSWLDFLNGLIPSNFLGLGASTQEADGSLTTAISFNVLQIVVIAIVVGIAALRSGKAAEPFLGFTRSALAVVQKILWWVIRLAPLGTLGLIGRAVATYGWDLLAPLGSFAVAIYVGLALVLFVVYPVILRTQRARDPSASSGARGRRSSSRSCRGRPSARCPSRSGWSSATSACRARTPRSRFRSRRPPRWTAAPRSTRRSPRSSSRSCSASTCRSPTTCSSRSSPSSARPRPPA